VSAVLVFRVAGLPIPQGSKNKSATGHLYDDNAKRLKPWRRDVTAAAVAALPLGWLPLNEPLRVVCLFAMPKPKSAPKRRRIWPIGRGCGDVDKLARAVLDSLEAARVVVNDSVFVDLHAIKDYPGPDVEQDAPGVLVAVYRIAEPGTQAALDLTEGTTTP
jgi:Holliday junction resolvase RusA-like endonuclease